MNTCGRCEHGKLVPKDLSKRICFGGPPSVIAIPKMTPTGPAIDVQNWRPTMNANEPACGVFKLKLLGLDESPKQANG